MSVDLKGRSLPHFMAHSKEEILYLLDLSLRLKKEKKDGIYNKYMENLNIALIFEKPSTRTRSAFTVAANDTGAKAEYLSTADIQLGKKESIEDTARVLGRMFDAIEFRGFKQEHVDALIKYSKVPVFNGLTDLFHPTQALADIMTIYEHLGKLEGITMAYVGDGRNNVANSLMEICAKVGMNYRCVSPKALWPDEKLVETYRNFATENGSVIEIIDDPTKGVKGADVIYTDVWVSMGEEEKSAERVSILKPFQVNDLLMQETGKKSILLHCLPAVKGNEVTEDVFEAHADEIFDQAENRMHSIKAIMVASLSK